MDPHFYTGFELRRLKRGARRTLGVLDRFFPGAAGRIDAIIAAVDSFYRRRPPSVQAQHSPGDLAFLEACLSSVRPQLVVEVGVASGFSSAFLIESLSRHCADGSRRVISFDPARRVEWDDELATGFAVPLMAPDEVGTWEFRRGETLLDWGGCAPSHGRVAALVDGEHRHPWPLVDVLVLLDTLPTGSWILLQDIDHQERLLGDAVRLKSDPQAGFRGPALVYEYWSATKVRGLDALFNMCALKTPDRGDIPALRRRLLETLAYPDEGDRSEAVAEYLRNAVAGND